MSNYLNFIHISILLLIFILFCCGLYYTSSSVKKEEPLLDAFNVGGSLTCGGSS